jgi:hypothetical protein
MGLAFTGDLESVFPVEVKLTLLQCGLPASKQFPHLKIVMQLLKGK